MPDIGQGILRGVTDQIQGVTMQGKYCPHFSTSTSNSSAGSAGSPSELYPKSICWQLPTTSHCLLLLSGLWAIVRI